MTYGRPICTLRSGSGSRTTGGAGATTTTTLPFSSAAAAAASFSVVPGLPIGTRVHGRVVDVSHALFVVVEVDVDVAGTTHVGRVHVTEMADQVGGMMSSSPSSSSPFGHLKVGDVVDAVVLGEVRGEGAEACSRAAIAYRAGQPTNHGDSNSNSRKKGNKRASKANKTTGEAGGGPGNGTAGGGGSSESGYPWSGRVLELSARSTALGAVLPTTRYSLRRGHGSPAIQAGDVVEGYVESLEENFAWVSRHNPDPKNKQTNKQIKAYPPTLDHPPHSHTHRYPA